MTHNVRSSLHALNRAMRGHNLEVETFHWIIQIGFYSFLLKQKSDKILHSFFPAMRIPFGIAILFVRENY